MNAIDHTYQEKELLQLVAEGDEAAFRKIYDVYRQRIYNLGMHLTRSEVLSEEIVQDVFMKLWNHKAQLTEINYFNTWLRTITKNTATDYLRVVTAERLRMVKYAVLPKPENINTEHELASKEYEAILEKAVQNLSPQQQKVYRLSREQGMKQEEIAKALGISVYTVKEYMKIALRSIRTYLDNHIDIAILLAIALYLD